ncbi:MAG: hypothetical protein IPL32_17680 [Chloracidobacterium sp.]|nr:hypothetical protein [Chloracidobacterium sp.]
MFHGVSRCFTLCQQRSVEPYPQQGRDERDVEQEVVEVHLNWEVEDELYYLSHDALLDVMPIGGSNNEKYRTWGLTQVRYVLIVSYWQ